MSFLSTKYVSLYTLINLKHRWHLRRANKWTVFSESGFALAGKILVHAHDVCKRQQPSTPYVECVHYVCVLSHVTFLVPRDALPCIVNGRVMACFYWSKAT